jgi:hypothetical protein
MASANTLGASNGMGDSRICGIENEWRSGRSNHLAFIVTLTDHWLIAITNAAGGCDECEHER